MTKLGEARSVVLTNQGISRTLMQREAAAVINLPVPHRLGTPVSGPRPL